MLNAQFIPAADKNSRRLFVVLHGLGDSAAGWRWFPPALDLPEMNYLLVNAPDEYSGGFSWFEYPGDLTPVARLQRLLVTHGRFDPVIPFTNVQAQIRQLQAAGLDVAWHEFPKEHTIHGAEEIAVIREFVRAGYGAKLEG